MRLAATLCFFIVIGRASVQAQSPPTPASAADELRITLSKDVSTALPAIPACTGDAAAALECEVYLVTLRNIGTHTIRLANHVCQHPDLMFSNFIPGVTPELWWRQSVTGVSSCGINSDDPSRPVLLRPGDQLYFRARWLKHFYRDVIKNREVTFRAELDLRGCLIDGPLADDCNTPMRLITLPVSVVPPAPPLFETPRVSVLASEIVPPAPISNGKLQCTMTTADQIDCKLFHIEITNEGGQALLSVPSCGPPEIYFQYREPGGNWKTLQQMNATLCAGGASQPLLPHHSLSFNRDSWGNYTEPLHKAGIYELQFVYSPQLCLAAPDASFCITEVKNFPVITSPVVTVHLTDQTQSKE